jgi:hypothetical protein
MHILGFFAFKDGQSSSPFGGVIRMDCDQNLTFGHTLVDALRYFFRQANAS